MSGGNKSLARRSPARRQVPSSAISTATSTLIIKKIPSSWKSILILATMVIVDKPFLNIGWKVNNFQMPPRTPSAQGHAPSPSPLPNQRLILSKIFLIHFLLLQSQLLRFKNTFPVFFKITFLSEAFLGQVLCWTNKHKDCWRRPAKKTGENLLQNIRETFKRHKLTKAHWKDWKNTFQNARRGS